MTSISQNILLHLRFPFSIFLLPVFLFAISTIPYIYWQPALAAFAILHLLVYPASNGYNSLQDNDTGSIGGIKSPPKVPAFMLWVTTAMDIAALLLMLWLVGSVAAALTAAYILASRAYSWRKIRLKKYPIVGFLTVAIFQGPVVFILTIWAATNHFYFSTQNMLALIISFLLLGAGYPLTQIYQHNQDGADGVKTLSMLLGIKGTFVFSGILFGLLGATLFSFFFFYGDGFLPITIMALALAPVGYIFTKWMLATFANTDYANYDNTMRMNKWGSLSLNILFLVLAIINIAQIV